MFIVLRKRYAVKTKRRAKRTKSGMKTEFVVISGSSYSPLVKSLSLDLERRGFVVYILAGTLSEEQIVQGYGKSDIRPLSLDVTSVSLISHAL